MVESLENLSYIALASTFWENNKSDKPYPSNDETYAEYLEAACKFGQQMKKFKLPKAFELEARRAILEIGRRKTYKRCMMHALEGRILRAYFKIYNAKEVLNTPTYLEAVQKLEGLLRGFFADPGSYLNIPGLDEFFSDAHHQQIVLKLFFAMTLQNPGDDRSAIRESWMSDTFVPSQSIFIDNFADIWRCIAGGVNAEIDSVRLQEEVSPEGKFLKCDILKRLMYRFPINEIIPWFVFDVLTSDQRDKFLALAQSTFLEENHNFMSVFATIFCHWPWQDEAFAMCFEGKEELTDNDMILLELISKCTRKEEIMVLNIGMLTDRNSFHLKVKNFVDSIEEADSSTDHSSNDG